MAECRRRIRAARSPSPPTTEPPRPEPSPPDTAARVAVRRQWPPRAVPPRRGRRAAVPAAAPRPVPVRREPVPAPAPSPDPPAAGTRSRPPPAPLRPGSPVTTRSRPAARPSAAGPPSADARIAATSRPNSDRRWSARRSAWPAARRRRRSVFASQSSPDGRPVQRRPRPLRPPTPARRFGAPQAGAVPRMENDPRHRAGPGAPRRDGEVALAAGAGRFGVRAPVRRRGAEARRRHRHRADVAEARGAACAARTRRRHRRAGRAGSDPAASS